MNLTKFTSSLIRKEDGPTSVEYAVMLALILGVIIGSVTLFGGAAGNLFSNISDDVEEVMGD